jgi:hypothetical protein
MAFPELMNRSSPVQNRRHPSQSNNPVVKQFSTPADKYGTAAGASTSSAPLPATGNHY